jgi:hypothetical protein
MQRQAQQAIMSAISIGIGSYLPLLVSGYLGRASVQQFLAARNAAVAAAQTVLPTNV